MIFNDSGLARLAIGSEHPRELRSGCLQHAGDPCRRRLKQSQELAAELIERRHGSEGLDALGVELLGAEAAPDDQQLCVLSGELDGYLRRSHGVARKSD